MKKLLVAMTLVGSLVSQGETYWLKAASGGATPPGCFAFYSDEACTSPVSVVPTKDDGNTYIVLGSQKMAGNYNAPAGTKWIFGADGDIVGTQKARPGFYTNGGVTLNYGECTIYGIQARCNGTGILKWGGVNTLVASGQEFTFRADNIEASTTRGVDLSGKFIGGMDVVVDFTYNNCKAGGTVKYVVSGDFSEYKGKLTASNASGVTRSAVLTFESDSAFGDPTVEMSDYLTLNSYATLVVNPVVTQYSTKGIKLNLTDSQEAYFSADAAQPWTLKAPLAGTKGTLAKIGGGVLTIASALEVKKLRVDEGTLVIDSAASFAAGTLLTVKSGATVVSRLGLNIPNVTVSVEEGGSFSFDFTVPYNGTSAITLDMSTMPGDEWDALVKPLPVQLSQAIPLPLNTTNRLAVVKFPKSLGVGPADFKDATPKTYGLPLTWFEVERAADADVLYLLARPAITLTESGSDESQALLSGESTDVWSDGRAAHEGADYIIENGATMMTGAAWDMGVFAFPGETLSLVDGLIMLNHCRSEFKRLQAYDGATICANGYASGDTRNTLAGTLEIVTGALTIKGSADGMGTENQSRHHIDVAATVIGSGDLSFGGDSQGYSPRFSGDGSNFAGGIYMRAAAHTALEFPDVLKLVGDRKIADPRTINAYAVDNGLWATENTTLEGVNYGIALTGGECYFGVDDGKTFTLNGNVRFQHQYSAKHGSGILALGGEILYSYDGHADPDEYFSGVGAIMSVHDGWIAPYAWNDGKSYRNMRLRFAAGETAGIAVDPQTIDEHIQKYGMCLEKDTAIQFASTSAKVYLKLALGNREGLPLEKSIRFPVLTVKNALAESIAGRLVAVKNVENAHVKIASKPADGLDGFTTFELILERCGLMLLVR